MTVQENKGAAAWHMFLAVTWQLELAEMLTNRWGRKILNFFPDSGPEGPTNFELPLISLFLFYFLHYRIYLYIHLHIQRAAL